MNKRSNWEEFKNILDQNHITKLYHFTDRDNLENIIKNGGLYFLENWMRGLTVYGSLSTMNMKKKPKRAMV